MERLLNPPALLRAALAVFVLAWLFGPEVLRSSVPIWLVFAIALVLEVQFFVGGLRADPERDPPDRGPQAVDRERFGYADDEDEDLWDTDLDEDDDADDEEELELGPERHPVRRFLVGLAVIVALGAVLWVVDSRRGWESLDSEARAGAVERFSAEASRIAGKPVTIECDESGRHVGAVQHSDGAAIVGGDRAYVTPERCLDLYRLAIDRDEPTGRTARALSVLAHEAWHLRGVADEGVTECYALQSGVSLGRRLGLSESTARRLMRQQLAENALRAGGSFEYRVPRTCRDGGDLDLDPSTSRFP